MVGALPLLTAHLGLLCLVDLSQRPAATLALLGLAFASLMVAARRPERLTGPGIVLVAALLRLLLLPLPPSLSEDTLRYVWDGRVAAAGHNPYRLAPEAEDLRPLRDGLWLRLPHRQVPTVYPPLAVALFSIAARLPWPVLGLKALLCLADLAGCLLLGRLAGRLGLPLARIVWYAWNPLVVLEVAGMGHVDALAVPAVVAAVGLLLPAPKPRPAAAATAAAAGILAKLVPLAALPMWARQSGAAGRFLTVALGLAAVAVAPVVAATGGVPPGLLTYGISWEFNGPLFEPLWRLLDAAGLDRLVKLGLDQVKEWSGAHGFWNRFYPYVYPQLLAKLALGAGMAAAVARSWRRRDPVAGTGWLVGTLLLFSATVYPWYLLWVLPWAALCRQVAWLGLSGLVLLSYLPQALDLPLYPWFFLAIWGPFLGLLARFPRWSSTG